MRYFLKVSYQGTQYHGWQKQHNALGIQTVVENALQKVLRHNAEISGSGRTDTGVHALQQYAHFDTETVISPDECRHRLNAILPGDIAVLEILPVQDQAHARFDAVRRSYEYHLHQFKNPFLTHRSYFFQPPLNLAHMNQAAALLAATQEKDYACFSKSGGGQQHTLCQIHHAQWHLHRDQQLVFNTTANRFLRNMVRAIVGTLIEVGTGRISLPHFKRILDSQDRRQAGRSVPAEGLYLSEVVYPPEIFR